MEMILGIVLSSYFLCALLIWSIFCLATDEQSTFAAFLLIVAAVVAYNIYHPSVKQILFCIPAYAIVGVIWSIWRFKRHVAAKLASFRQDCDSREKIYEVKNIDTVLYSLHPKRNVSFLVYHIILWPFSIIANILQDIVHGLKAFVREYMVGLYRRVLRGQMVRMGFGEHTDKV